MNLFDLYKLQTGYDRRSWFIIDNVFAPGNELSPEFAELISRAIKIHSWEAIKQIMVIAEKQRWVKCAKHYQRIVLHKTGV